MPETAAGFGGIGGPFDLSGRAPNLNGGVAEWPKATVLKTVIRKDRGFESYPLRQNFSGGEITDGLWRVTFSKEQKNRSFKENGFSHRLFVKSYK